MMAKRIFNMTRELTYLYLQDRSILSTAIPRITEEFNSLPDVGWYGSAYLLTSCCFQLLFGKLFAEFNIKWIYLVALGLFELGSLICALASSSVILIVGRAVAGLGSAGIFTGAILVSMDIQVVA
jgi:MFS family permease